MAWHQGYPLSQTVLSSVYIDRLLWPEPQSLLEANFDRKLRGSIANNTLVHVVLRAYCIGLVKCCDHVVRIITSEHYYEEEDFTTHTFNRDLLSNIGNDQILDTLNGALACLEEQSSSLRSSLYRSITARLELRIEMLQAFSSNHPKADLFDRIQDLIEIVRSSADTGVSVKTAFSEKVQRRLASTAPPKPVIEIGTDQAFERLKQICSDIREAHRLREVNYLSSPENLRVSRFSLVGYSGQVRPRGPKNIPMAQISSVMASSICSLPLNTLHPAKTWF